MPYPIQAEWLRLMEAFQYVCYLISACAGVAFVVYLIVLAVLCAREVGSLPKPRRHDAANTNTGGYVMNQRTITQHILLICAFAFFAASPGFAQAPAQRQAETEITKLQQDWLAALLKGDGAPLQRIFADDYLGASETGASADKAQSIAAVRPAPAAATPPQVSVSENRIRLYGSAAVSTGLLTLKTPAESIGLRYTVVLNKARGQWQVVSSHVSRVAAAAANAEQELTQFAAEWTAALKQGDAAALERVYAADFLGTNENGQRFDREQLKSILKAGAIKYESIEGTELQSRVEGNLAVANVVVTTKGTNQGQAFNDKTRATHTLIRRQGRWQVLASSAVRLPSQ